MHHISKITIQNYKSIIDEEFPLSIYTPLVGYNNAGKTNIMNAINWLIKTSNLLVEDYNDREQPVVVTAEISGITDDVLTAIGEAHRERIRPYLDDGKINIRKIQEIPNSGAKGIKLEILQNNEGDECVWDDNPTGIDNAITYLFPEPIFIGAMENAAEDVKKFGTGTTIGKLIKEIIEPIAEEHSEGVRLALAEISEKLSADSPQRDDRLRDVDAGIRTELTSLFPGVSVKIHIPVSEFSDFLKGATIKIFDDEYNRPNGQDPSSFGHGTQRTVQIALIKYLAKIKRNNAQTARTTLILIDEPELYLHPQAIELVRSSLDTLTKEGYQVIFTTHSANMIAKTDAEKTLLIRRDSATGTTAYPRIKKSVKEVIDGADNQSDMLFELNNSTNILFSEKVILAEGKTERTLIPVIYEHEINKMLAQDKIGLVALSGSGNVPNAMKVLQAMKLPVKAIMDLDFAFSNAAESAGLIQETNADIIACKAVLARLYSENKIGLNAEGLPQKNGNVSAAKAFELMAQELDAQTPIENLHNVLRGQDIWLWKRGTIETHLGLVSKKNPAHRKFINDLSNAGFTDTLLNYQDVKDMLVWLPLPPVYAQQDL